MKNYTFFKFCFILIYSVGILAPIHSQSKLFYNPVIVKNYFNNFFNVKYPAKDEYETYAQYFNRIKIPRIEKGQLFYFETNATTYYNADDSILTIYMGYLEYMGYSKYKLLLDESIKKVRTYKAKNGLGNSVNVTEYKHDYYYLDSLNLSSLKDTCPDCLFTCDVKGKDVTSIKVIIKIEPKKAKKIAKSMIGVFVVNIDSYFDRKFDYDYTEPEFNSPLELTQNYYLIHANIKQIYLCEKSSKQIFNKINLTSLNE